MASSSITLPFYRPRFSEGIPRHQKSTPADSTIFAWVLSAASSRLIGFCAGDSGWCGHGPPRPRPRSRHRAAAGCRVWWQQQGGDHGRIQWIRLGLPVKRVGTGAHLCRIDHYDRKASARQRWHGQAFRPAHALQSSMGLSRQTTLNTRKNSCLWASTKLANPLKIEVIR